MVLSNGNQRHTHGGTEGGKEHRREQARQKSQNFGKSPVSRLGSHILSVVSVLQEPGAMREELALLWPTTCSGNVTSGKADRNQ